MNNFEFSNSESELSINEVFDGEIPFPLPVQKDESLCRDTYLKRILLRYGQIEDDPSSERKRSTVRMARYLQSWTGEGLAIMQMLEQNERKETINDITQFRASLTLAELKVLYTIFLGQFQKASIEFLCVRLKKQMDTLVNIFPGEVDEIPHKLFHWSSSHFLNRFKVNQLYLEVLPKERSEHDLDCTKFCIDVTEIMRLVDAIKLDFATDKDICQSSLLVINDSNYENTSTWVTEVANLRHKLKKLNHKLYASAHRLQSTYGPRLLADNDKIEALMHIEVRYRVNWLRSAGEQHLLWLQGKEMTYEEEMNELVNKMRQDHAAFGFVQFVYQYQIDNYRASIITWQEQLDVDLEAAELECNITRNLWIKAKDDLRYLKDEVEMFKRRVAEVLELIAEEQNTRRSRATNSIKFTPGANKHKRNQKKGK